MSTVRLIPLGVGEAFSACHYTSCLALGLDDEWLLIDCPHPILKMLREGSAAAGVPLDPDRVVGVAVSHLHADHCCGLEDFGFYSTIALGRRARLLMHPEVSARLWSGLLAAGMELSQVPGGPATRHRLEDYFELIGLDDSAPTPFGPFAIECRRTIHGVPTTALKIKVGGRTLGFSADTAFDPGLIDWLAPADLIVHEATTAGYTGVHTPYEKLAGLPAGLRARIRLTHCPDDFDPGPGGIELLRQGHCYTL
ncbi:MAG: MBL fold metallo-hydrolase [Isosphaeraceae bacterium]